VLKTKVFLQACSSWMWELPVLIQADNQHFRRYGICNNLPLSPLCPVSPTWYSLLRTAILHHANVFTMLAQFVGIYKLKIGHCRNLFLL